MDLSTVKPLDLTGVLGNVKKRVALVGVELEGGWIELPPGVPALEHDGSVFGGRIPTGARYIGEVSIGPVPREGIPALMKSHFPSKINSTCGMHVHMSFTRLFHYHLLMVPEYQETVLHYLMEWAKEQGLKDSDYIWPRLRGESKFCQKKFWPDAQASTKKKGHDQNAHGHRYTVIHYCGRHPYPNPPTIECRVLPMMTFARATQAVQRLLDITDACVHVLGKQRGGQDKRAAGKITLPDNMVYEETIIESL